MEENTHLWSLLKLHGVSNQEIHQYLAKADNNMPMKSHLKPVLEARPYPQKSLKLNEVDNKFSQIGSSNFENKRQSHDIGPTEPILTHISPLTSQQVIPFKSQITEGEQKESVIDTFTQNTSKLKSSSTIQNSGQYTPCEKAAEIIMSMKTYSDANDVRLELGCQSNSSCMVRNMDIFHFLDD